MYEKMKCYEMKHVFIMKLNWCLKLKKIIQAKHHFEYASRSYLDLVVCLVIAETKEFPSGGKKANGISKWHRLTCSFLQENNTTRHNSLL